MLAVTEKISSTETPEEVCVALKSLAHLPEKLELGSWAVNSGVLVRICVS